MSIFPADVLPITVDVTEYARLAVSYSETAKREQEAEIPEAQTLSAKIKEITTEAKSLGVTFDDDTVAANTDAARLREEIDKHLPRFQELARRSAERIAMLKYLNLRVQNANAAGIAVAPVEFEFLLGLTGGKIPREMIAAV